MSTYQVKTFDSEWIDAGETLEEAEAAMLSLQRDDAVRVTLHNSFNDSTARYELAGRVFGPVFVRVR